MSIEVKHHSNLDLSDLDGYSSTLENIFSSLVKKFNKMQLSDHTNQTISDANILINKGRSILNTMKAHIKSMDVLLSDCDDFVEEVIEDIATPHKEEEFVHHTAGGMLSYPGRELLKNILIKQPELSAPIPVATPLKPESQVERTLIPEIGYYLRLPVVKNIKSIQPAMCYFKGDGETPAGIYMNLPNNNIVRVPFPEIVDSKREYDRTHSIRCKYHNKEECNAQRSKMSKLYNSQVRVCNFAHTGDKIIKIGYPSRCPSVPDFGNPTTMSSDIKKVNMNDINNMLLYGMNDIMCSVIYLDYHSMSDKIMNSLEKA